MPKIRPVDLDTNEAQMLKLQAAFERRCDDIQKDTEKLLKAISGDDKKSHMEILKRHKLKLDEALAILQKKLDALV